MLAQTRASPCLPALCNHFSSLRLTGSTPATSLSHKSVFIRSDTLQVFKMREFKGNWLLFGRGRPSSLFSAGQVASFHLNGAGSKRCPAESPRSEALQPAALFLGKSNPSQASFAKSLVVKSQVRSSFALVGTRPGFRRAPR